MSPAFPERVVVVPSAPALLPSYAGQVDPLADLRAAAVDAVRWLVSGTPERVVVLGAGAGPADVARGVPEPLGPRVARTLFAEAGFDGTVVEAVVSPSRPGPTPALMGRDVLLVVADGSARRGERAPGHLDERAFGYDEAVEKALRAADLAALGGLDLALGDDLLAGGPRVLHALAATVVGDYRAEVDYADDPFGVRYWVVRWQCES